MDTMSNDNDRDMMLGGINSKYIEKKFEIVLNHSLGQGDTEAILTYKIPSQQIENRKFLEYSKDTNCKLLSIP